MKIKSQDFEKELSSILQDYADMTQADLSGTVREVVNMARRTVRELSPVEEDPPKGRAAGRYKRGWRTKIVNEGYTVTGYVYQGTLPGLTHLLEYGHAMRQGGRAEADEHISVAQEEASKSFEGRLIKRL